MGRRLMSHRRQTRSREEGSRCASQPHEVAKEPWLLRNVLAVVEPLLRQPLLQPAAQAVLILHHVCVVAEDRVH